MRLENIDKISDLVCELKIRERQLIHLRLDPTVIIRLNTEKDIFVIKTTPKEAVENPMLYKISQEYIDKLQKSIEQRIDTINAEIKKL